MNSSELREAFIDIKHWQAYHLRNIVGLIHKSTEIKNDRLRAKYYVNLALSRNKHYETAIFVSILVMRQNEWHNAQTRHVSRPRYKHIIHISIVRHRWCPKRLSTNMAVTVVFYLPARTRFSCQQTQIVSKQVSYWIVLFHSKGQKFS